jgi:hypothetical protein
MIQLSGSGSFLVKWGCWGHWGHWDCWGCWGHWGCRGFKASKITTEDFRLIQVLELSFISMFLEKKSLVESWSIKLDLSNFSVWGCWGQPMLLFWKVVANIKMSWPRVFVEHIISMKLSILIPVRAKLLYPFWYETPCSAPQYTVMRFSDLKETSTDTTADSIFEKFR